MATEYEGLDYDDLETAAVAGDMERFFVGGEGPFYAALQDGEGGSTADSQYKYSGDVDTDDELPTDTLQVRGLRTQQMYLDVAPAAGSNQSLRASDIGGPLTDHGLLSGLGDDDHAQYALLLGRSTGQSLIGGTASGEDLTLQSTSHATKGSILFGTSAYDEVNNFLGLNIVTPTEELDVNGDAWIRGDLAVGVDAANDTYGVHIADDSITDFLVFIDRNLFAANASTKNGLLVSTFWGADSGTIADFRNQNDSHLLIGGAGTVTVNASQDSTVSPFIVNSEGQANLFIVRNTDEVEINGVFKLIHTAAENDDHAAELIVDAAGFGDVEALEIQYITGATVTGDDEAVILINIDETDALGGDFFGIDILSTPGSADKMWGMGVGVGIGPVEHHSGAFGDMDTWDNDGVDETGKVTGVGTSAVFISNSDYVIVADAAKFEEISIDMTTAASGGGIKPTFEFSTGGSGFTAFSPIDGTTGFRFNGVIIWDLIDIAAWATNASGDFEIRIVRTRVTLATPPVVDTAQIAAPTNYFWDKDGTLYVAKLGVGVSDPAAAVEITGNLLFTQGANRTITIERVIGGGDVDGNDFTIVAGESIGGGDGGDLTLNGGSASSGSVGNVVVAVGKLGVGEAAPVSLLHLTADAPIITVDATNDISGLRIDSIGITSADSPAFRVQADGTTLVTVQKDGEVVVANDLTVSGEFNGGTHIFTQGLGGVVATTTYLNFDGVTGSTTVGQVMPKDGSITDGAAGVTISGHSVNGTITFRININNIWSHSLTSGNITGDGAIRFRFEQARGLDTFVANDFISVRVIVNSGTFTVNDASCALVVVLN